jgi:hypothetical protein
MTTQNEEAIDDKRRHKNLTAFLWRLVKCIQHGTMQSFFFLSSNVMSGLLGYRGFDSGVRSLDGKFFFFLAGILLH